MPMTTNQFLETLTTQLSSTIEGVFFKSVFAVFLISSTFIAENLGISENTVRTHVRHIYEKLGVSSREELIAYVDDIGKTQAHSEG